jgi:NADH-ubiquinone oxidoreductase chain 2
MLILLIIFILTSVAITVRSDRSILYSKSSLINLTSINILLYSDYNYSLVGKSISLIGGLVYMSNIAYLFHIFIFVIGSLIITLTSFYPRKIVVNEYSSLYKLLFYNLLTKASIINKKSEMFKIIEYSLLLLFVILGTLFLISSTDLVTMFISLELQSYGLYIVSTVYRNSESSTGGGLMYFLLGGLSSCFILLGSSLLYINSGTTSFDNLSVINNISTYSLSLDTNNIYWYKSFYIIISFIIMVVGFLFKVSAAPFHFWSPDVYDAIPTIVTTFVAIIAKISIFVLLLELVNISSKTPFSFYWNIILIVSSLLSLIIGSVLGLTQTRIKRLYAYSTISHVGFILLALSISNLESIQAFIFYILQYSISNLNIFILLLSAGYLFYNYLYKGKENYNDLEEKNYSPVQYISQIKGYFEINTILALSLALTLFSFIGVPPLIGFFGKQMILSAAIDKGFYFMSIIAILTSVIAAVYYLVVVKEVFFYKKEYDRIESYGTIEGYSILKKRDNIINNNGYIEKVYYTSENITLSSSITIIISVITIIVFIFMFSPNEMINSIVIVSHDYADTSLSWGVYFQNSASPQMERLV